MEDFTTVFLFKDNIAGWLIEAVIRLGVGCIVLAFALSVLNEVRKKSGNADPILVVIGIFASIFSVGWLGCHGCIYLGSGATLTRLLIVYETERYEVTEGNVQVIRSAKSNERLRRDHIKVNDTEFEITTNTGTFGYDKVIIEGGVLTDGTSGKVYYYDDIGNNGGAFGWGRTILRIDLKSPSEASND